MNFNTVMHVCCFKLGETLRIFDKHAQKVIFYAVMQVLMELEKICLLEVFTNRKDTNNNWLLPWKEVDRFYKVVLSFRNFCSRRNRTTDMTNMTVFKDSRCSSIV